MMPFLFAHSKMAIAYPAAVKRTTLASLSLEKLLKQKHKKRKNNRPAIHFLSSS